MASSFQFLNASDIKVLKLNFAFDKRVTIIRENPYGLQYFTPHFRAAAVLEIPSLANGMNVKIGWIQVCTELKNICNFGSDGLVSWEFPEIVTGKYKMVSDADGKQYPWYGTTNEVKHLRGPKNGVTLTSVIMNDYFFPVCPWYIEHSAKKEPSLEFIYSKQKFYTYLVLMDVNISTYQIIRTLTWTFEIAIDVIPQNPVGKRCALLGPYNQACPMVVPEHLIPPLQCYALKPPNANSCQACVWRPYNGMPKLIVTPIQTTMDMDKYLVDTSRYVETLTKFNKSNFMDGKL